MICLDLINNAIDDFEDGDENVTQFNMKLPVIIFIWEYILHAPHCGGKQLNQTNCTVCRRNGD